MGQPGDIGGIKRYWCFMNNYHSEMCKGCYHCQVCEMFSQRGLGKYLDKIKSRDDAKEGD